MNDQFTEGQSVDPNDTNLLSSKNNGGAMLYIGTAGDIKVETVGGSVLNFKDHPSGYMPGRVIKVFQTGTTATDIIALW